MGAGGKIQGRKEALGEDCKIADLVLSGEKLAKKLCNEKIVIDKWDFHDNGAHAVYFKENGEIVIRTVAQERGIRPWSWREKRVFKDRPTF